MDVFNKIGEQNKKSAGKFKIPIIAKAESLNVAMSASIPLYDVIRQRA